MAENALDNAKKIIELHEKYLTLLNTDKKTPEIAHRLLEHLFSSIVISISSLSKKWGIGYTSIQHGIKCLARLNIIEEVSGRSRNKLYTSNETT